MNGQMREQIVKFTERFSRNERRAEQELRTLRTQHPTRDGIDFAVRLAIDTLAGAVFSPHTNRHSQSEEGMPSVIDRYSLDIIRIM